MLTRLQRLITFSLIAFSCGWAFYFHADGVVALGGFLVVILGYSAVLAAELLALWGVNDAASLPQPTFKELLSAWWGEILIAPLVFCWLQPFRTNAIPDQLALKTGLPHRRGVVLVHGFFCNRGFWTPWLKRLQGSGHAFVALDLEPVFGSIDGYALQIDEAVSRVTQATGLPPLLVGHSMGGLAVRSWLKQMKGVGRVHHVVTIGSPHHGTWLAQFGFGHNCRQMRLLSEWQAQLDVGMPADHHTLFTCWYSNSDNVVFPAANATLAQADNRLLRGVAHVQMAFLPEVIETTLAMLEHPLPAARRLEAPPGP